MHSGSRWRHTFLLALMATLVGALLSSGASAQSDPAPQDIGVFGRLDFEEIDSGEEVPVAGVTIEVEGVGKAESDENGEFRIAVRE